MTLGGGSVLYDQGMLVQAPQRTPAENISRARLASKPVEQAVMTHGGFGYAKEYNVERYTTLSEITIPRIAPVSRELILSFIAEKVLGCLPKSY